MQKNIKNNEEIEITLKEELRRLERRTKGQPLKLLGYLRDS